MPVSFPSGVENEDKLEELDEEGVEDPEEGEVGPVGMVVVEEVEDEGLNISGDIKDRKYDVEENEFEKLEYLHLEFSFVLQQLKRVT